MRLIVLWIVAAVAMAACSNQRSSQNRLSRSTVGPSLRLVDSTVLVDSDTNPLGAYTSFFARSAAGMTYVGDQQHKRIAVFGLDGRRLRDIGHAGSGPGEFQAPAAVGLIAADSILVVIDQAQRTMSLFDAKTGRLIHSLIVPFEWGGQDWVTRPHQVLFATSLSPTMLVRWNLLTDSIVRFAPVPRGLLQNAAVYLSHGQANVAEVDGGFAMLLPTDPGARILDDTGSERGVVIVPVARRAGEPADIVERQRKLPHSRRYDIIGSSADGIRRLSTGELLLAHLDVERLGDADHGRFGNYRLYVSIISPDYKRACVDGLVPVRSDAAIVPAFAGDTMFVITRTVTDDNQVINTAIGFLIDTDRCDWRPTGGLRRDPLSQ